LLLERLADHSAGDHQGARAAHRDDHPDPGRRVPTCVKNVLANEWIASWRPDALKAAAVAAKFYAWYWATHFGGHGNSPAACSDVIDDQDFQVYRANGAHPASDAAVVASWPFVVRRNGQTCRRSAEPS
jgi:hypothetical protein